MSIKFDPESLRQEVNNLIEFFNAHNIGNDFQDEYPFNENDDDDSENEEVIVNEDTEFNIWLPKSEYEEGSYTLGEVLAMVQEAINAKKLDEYSLIGKRLALIPIDSYNMEQLNRIMTDNPSIIGVIEKVDEQEYTLNIVQGLTSYGFALTIQKKYSKYVPPVDYSDVFIEIWAEHTLDDKIIDSLVQAYIFEIKSSLDIEIHISPRSTHEFWETDEVELSIPPRLRPFLRGKGINELLTLYNSSISSPNDEFSILTYSKVIEYVSQTVIQQDLISSTLNKLSSTRALTPDANYILELSRLFEEQRNNKKDHQAIKLTVETCCDLFEIVPIAPPFLNLTKALTINSKPDDKQKAYEEVATAISHTRNMFAHAKTNYESKGKECPKDQLHGFSRCVDILAQQVIRWFARQQEDNRVI
ncbi:hypothetical protein [Paenibacillus luteus]|uniref:hypothetical protein n=1 Tax=Paenibacillus luteus TaxID=2545753 RepID=UPI001144CB6F|nr:hypothetical protein [Paenibacillus luteus]